VCFSMILRWKTAHQVGFTLFNPRPFKVNLVGGNVQCKIMLRHANKIVCPDK
jgi:hypothetical protein